MAKILLLLFCSCHALNFKELAKKSFEEEMLTVKKGESQQMSSVDEAEQESLLLDPFLSQRVGDQQTHNRQESADSGLGMASTVYPPIITEDMDTDIDFSLTESNIQVMKESTRFESQRFCDSSL